MACFQAGSEEEDAGGVTSNEKDPEAVTSNEGPLSTSGQSSAGRSDSPKEPAEEPKAISFLGALRIPVSHGTPLAS